MSAGGFGVIGNLGVNLKNFGRSSDWSNSLAEKIKRKIPANKEYSTHTHRGKITYLKAHQAKIRKVTPDTQTYPTM